MLVPAKLDDVDYRPIQAIARSLPPTSLVRRLVLTERPTLPRSIFLDRAEILVRAIFAEQETVAAAKISEAPLKELASALADAGAEVA